MCYGAFCESNTVKLRYDKPNQSTKNRRRRAAGCAPNPNRCSPKVGHRPGYSCDEYPFATTVVRGGRNRRINRCVPAVENRRQGGTISAFYRGTCKGNPCDFDVGFTRAQNIPFCQNQCSHDPDEQVGPGGAKRFMSRDFVNDTSNNVYHTASGADIIVPSGAEINQTVWTVVPIDKTLWDYQVENHVDKSEDENEKGSEDEDEYEYMLDNLKLVPDVIVGNP